jgi:NAD(P)-dependent dehydrogenase (short-subunit alcohol dehydrogenase family)
VEAAGRRAVLVKGDIREEEHCISLVERAFSEFGKLDILVNNAAHQSTHESIEEWTTEEFDRTYKTNIYAMFWLCRAAVPRMKPGASIINTASIQAFSPSSNLVPYASTKAAIVNFSKGLAKLIGDKGIRVNAVAPGPVWTPLIPPPCPMRKCSRLDLTPHSNVRLSPLNWRLCLFSSPLMKQAMSPPRLTAPQRFDTAIKYPCQRWEKLIAERVPSVPLFCFASAKTVIDVAAIFHIE